MPRIKRRRLLTPLRKKSSKYKGLDYKEKDTNEVSTPRGRLKGALLEALDPAGGEESDTSVEHTPIKRHSTRESKKNYQGESDDEDTPRKKSPQRQSYVLKLFDRSVDLSQFKENSPLYPICRAWIANQPKANYSKFGRKFEDPPTTNESVELPGPEGTPVSRIPDLLPEQLSRDKDFTLNYRESVLPNRQQLLQSHLARWSNVRKAWLEQSTKVEARYEATQQLLNKINVNGG